MSASSYFAPQARMGLGNPLKKSRRRRAPWGCRIPKNSSFTGSRNKYKPGVIRSFFLKTQVPGLAACAELRTFVRIFGLKSDLCIPFRKPLIMSGSYGIEFA